MIDYADKAPLHSPPSIRRAARRLVLDVRIWFAQRDIDGLNRLIKSVEDERATFLADRATSTDILTALKRERG